MPERCWISIVMPALNEAANVRDAITDTLRAIDDYQLDGEIIVVDDGSSDGTGEVVSEIMKTEPRVRKIRHEQPKGIGFALWHGVNHAHGEIVCMIPGDNENDPWETLRYWKLLEHVDIVIPFVFNRQVRSAFRNLLSAVYRVIINTTFRVNFNYTNGTVLYRRSILKELDFHSRGFFYQTDILIRTVKKGYLFAEVPYQLNARPRGKSKAVSYPSLVKVVRGYLRLFRDFYYKRNITEADEFAPDSQTAVRRGGDAAPDGKPADETAPAAENSPCRRN